MRFIWLVLLAISRPGLAGDRDQLEFLGFSRGGQFAAYEIHGISDGSGFPYSEVFVIEVEKNVYSGGPYYARGDDAGASDKESDKLLKETRRKASSKAQNHLKKVGIDGSAKGKLLVHHPRSDVGTDSKTVRFMINDELPNGGDTMRLELSESAISLPGCDSLGVKASLLELGLMSEQSKRKIALQKDERVPSSRGCAYDYRIESVHYHPAGSLLVFVSYLRPGYEGPDRKYLAVSGKLP